MWATLVSLSLNSVNHKNSGHYLRKNVFRNVLAKAFYITLNNRIYMSLYPQKHYDGFTMENSENKSNHIWQYGGIWQRASRPGSNPGLPTPFLKSFA